jgi:penicillin amidase
VWYEVVLRAGARWGAGATMPGIPALVIGRTSDLAWGATYAFMDAIDSWIEECRDGRRRRDDAPGGWAPFRVRRETIRRKKGAPVEVTFHESEHGVLDGDPGREGLYLATRWSGAQGGAASIEAMARMWTASSVEEGRALIGRLELAFNWVLADRAGSIGYQMSGLLPKRRAGASGLVPLPGWDPANDWHGFHAPADLPRALDPEAGFFVTANQDLNAYGKVSAITVPMASYRAERIAQALAGAEAFTTADARRLHYDVLSLQAERFMTVLGPLLPETEQARILRGWDRRYDLESRGAFLFEAFYRALLEEVFGRGGLGAEAVAFLGRETGIFADFYANFDRVLLSERSAWFGDRTRDEAFRAAAERALAVEPRPWGASQEVTLSHILFGGKLPRRLGFDRGPIAIPGGRATVQQGQIYRSAGRLTSFAPSFRFVTDLARDEAESVILGGPSDRRFSRWYDSDTANWAAGRYKTLRP